MLAITRGDEWSNLRLAETARFYFENQKLRQTPRHQETHKKRLCDSSQGFHDFEIGPKVSESHNFVVEETKDWHPQKTAFINLSCPSNPVKNI